MCSKVDGEDCHQIDHCQLVSGPNNECTCQDPCQKRGRTGAEDDHLGGLSIENCGFL